MKINLFNKQTAAAVLLLGFAASCTVEDTLDVSKEIDATVAIGNGISFPLGSTDKIMLTEMIKTGDVLKADEDGTFRIVKEGEIKATSIKVDEVDVEIAPLSRSEKFDLSIIAKTKEQLEDLQKEAENAKETAEETALNAKQEAEATALAEKEKAYDEIDKNIPSSILPEENATAKAEADKVYNEVIAEIQSAYDELVNTINDEFEKLYEEYDKMMKGEIDPGEISHTLENINVDYNFDAEVPEGVDFIQKVLFDKPTELKIDIAIQVEGDDENFSSLIDTLYMNGVNEDEKFYIEVPRFIVFKESEEFMAGTHFETIGDATRLYIEGGAAKRINSTDPSKHLIKTFYIDGFDFSYKEEKGIYPENGKINIDEELKVEGNIGANRIKISLGDMLTINNVKLDANISIGEKNDEGKYGFTLKQVWGKFNPDIDPIEVDAINLELGDDMDFIYDNGIEFKFSNPELVLTINSEVPINATADLAMHSYDRNGEITNKGAVTLPLEIGEGENPIVINNSKFSDEKNLTYLLGRVPDKIKIEDIKPSISTEKVQHLELGNDMAISGRYSVNLAMEFDKIKLEYSEEFEDVLGENPEDITDYVSNIDKVVFEFDVLNTIPADFQLAVEAKDKNGRTLPNIEAIFTNENGEDAVIKAGKGYSSEATESKVIVTLSAKNGELELLKDLKMTFKGNGDKETNGGNTIILNENDFIKLQNMSISIEEPIIIDMN